ncbi:Galactoside 2-alpha-L-fucosyltransferase 1 [Heterocephalus glaber]|uniref:L-Fucosyltransferase n=1 Tax=Heterocephalus glaber TaxID=10181 RepID=G5BTF9_HETGA|nr:Galactoside 2-alpha-L-fucosyltransferase 1 [Heterocephalus glaber]EHB12563.1 Galactoside 2-alpha-L-fucosyltransferase 1 [Heterocephalus glaber]
MHATLAPGFQITLPELAPKVESHMLWQELQLHDWMSEEYLRLKDPFLKLFGFSCSWTTFHHLLEQICSEFTLHDHLSEGPQGFLRELCLQDNGQKGNRGKDFALLTAVQPHHHDHWHFGFWAGYLAGSNNTIYLASFTLLDSVPEDLQA